MLRVIVSIFIAAGSAALGTILVRRGMQQVGSLENYAPLALAGFFWHALCNPYVIVGTFLNAVFYFLFLAAFTVGFGERFTVRLIDRVASAIFGDAEAPRQAPQRPPAEGPAAPAPHGAAAAKGGVLLEVKGVDANQGTVKLLRDGAEVQPGKAEADAQGRFALSGLAPGEYEVQVQEKEEAPWRLTSPAKVRVEAGKETTIPLEIAP